MADKLDDLLRALPEPALDYPLDQLEPQVWGRIEKARVQGGLNLRNMQLQFAVAVATLCLGVALGWTKPAPPSFRQETPLLLTHADFAMVTGLGDAR